ncbi:MAG: HEAT repeat domain-containing protein [Anaerolineae bacterium]|nr:HEAT repeat domain-containing protein [Caldilineales bacterium]MDW8268247.1 HEAT repeat domain-containing protein [Anaerolineae bacterium]
MYKALKERWLRLRSLFEPAPLVVADLSHPQAERRWRAARALAGRPQLRYRAGLLALLDDPDPIVRDEAAATLASWGPASGLEPALDLLRRDPPAPRAAALLDLLARLPASAESRALLPDPAEPIGPFLSHADPLVRAAACRALAATGRGEDAQRLSSLTTDPDPRVRRAACVALGRLGNPDAIPLLQERLHDADPPTRDLASKALSRLEALAAAREKEEPEKRGNGESGSQGNGETESPSESPHLP